MKNLGEFNLNDSVIYIEELPAGESFALVKVGKIRYYLAFEKTYDSCFVERFSSNCNPHNGSKFEREADLHYFFIKTRKYIDREIVENMPKIQEALETIKWFRRNQIVEL